MITSKDITLYCDKADELDKLETSVFEKTTEFVSALSKELHERDLFGVPYFRFVFSDKNINKYGRWTRSDSCHYDILDHCLMRHVPFEFVDERNCKGFYINDIFRSYYSDDGEYITVSYHDVYDNKENQYDTIDLEWFDMPVKEVADIIISNCEYAYGECLREAEEEYAKVYSDAIEWEIKLKEMDEKKERSLYEKLKEKYEKKENA